MTDALEDAVPTSNELIDRAIRAWRTSQVVFESASWQGKPEARAIAEEIAEKHPELEPQLIGLSADSNQLVAAYALLALDLMNSRWLHSLPTELLSRTSKITLSAGSFRSSATLSEFARQLHKRSVARSVPLS
jgi:hypothetical protein